MLELGNVRTKFKGEKLSVYERKKCVALPLSTGPPLVARVYAPSMPHSDGARTGRTARSRPMHPWLLIVPLEPHTRPKAHALPRRRYVWKLLVRPAPRLGLCPQTDAQPSTSTCWAMM